MVICGGFGVLLFRTPGGRPARLVPGFDGTIKVGIIWSGRVTFKDNARRATTLNRFLRFLDVPKVRLYSIQKGPPGAELETLDTSTLITPLGPQLNENRVAGSGRSWG